MSRVKHDNPFAMGNLDDLFNARMNDDVEYLKEWSKKAVEYHNEIRRIQTDAHLFLIKINELSKHSLDEIRRQSIELDSNSSPTTIIDES